MSTPLGRTRRQQFLLGPYAHVISWLMEFAILSALPVLAAGAMFAVIDLLTGGVLSHVSDTFSLVWAVGQGVATELLFFSSFMRIAHHAQHGHWGKVMGWLLVGILLAIPSFQASVVYGMVHTFGITVPQAVSQLGITDMEWIVVRALAVIFVGVLEGIAAYAPEETQQTADEIEREAERKARIARAHATLAQARASAYAMAGKRIFRSTFSRDEEAGDSEEEDAPNGSGETVANPSAGATVASERSKHGRRIFSLAEARKLQQAKERGSAQNRIFEFLNRHPNAPNAQIGHWNAAHTCSLSHVFHLQFEVCWLRRTTICPRYFISIGWAVQILVPSTDI